jgi:hypothetical protein
VVYLNKSILCCIVGEVLKKKSITGIGVSDRWKKIAISTESNIFAIVRQQDGLIKFLRENAWDKWVETNFNEVDSSVLSVHCFIRGNSNLAYRNYYDIKDNYNKLITNTRSYELNVSEIEHHSVTMMTNADYIFTDLKATNIRNVMDLATCTIVRYIENLLDVKVKSLYVDYVIDTKSQLWALWTSEAKVVPRAVESKSRHTSPLHSRSAAINNESISAAAQIDTTLNYIQDSFVENSIGPRLQNTAEAQSNTAGFKMLDTDDNSAMSRAKKCHGDFCHIKLQSVGSLVSQEEVNQSTMDSFFTDEERAMLKDYDKYKSLTSLKQLEQDYDFIPMKSIIIARQERRNGKKEVAHESWRDYPTSPRDSSAAFPSRNDKVVEEVQKDPLEAVHYLHFYAFIL